MIIAAEAATTERLAFMIRHTSGVVCAPVLPQRLDQLEIPLMVRENTDKLGTAFTQSVDYRLGSSTGISASDRAGTIRALARPTSVAADFSRPGHVFPLRARPGGVLERAGHTEAAIDLVALAGRCPAAAISELVNDDGSMTRGAQLRQFAAKRRLAALSIADLVRYRQRHEPLIELLADTALPTRWGQLRCRVYRSTVDGAQTLAITVGEVREASDVLLRMHSECLTGDVFGSRRCDCGDQFEQALDRMSAQGRGVLLYMRGHEGRGIGLINKIRAYSLQDSGLDTVDANLELGLPVDAREYYVGAQIIRDLGIASVALLTNNPDKLYRLLDLGAPVARRIPLHSAPHRESVDYLLSKKQRMGHLLPAADDQRFAAGL